MVSQSLLDIAGALANNRLESSSLFPMATFRNVDELADFVGKVQRNADQNAGQNCLSAEVNWLAYNTRSLIVYAAHVSKALQLKLSVTLESTDSFATSLSVSDELISLFWIVCDDGVGKPFGENYSTFKTSFMQFATTLISNMVISLQDGRSKSDLTELQRIQKLMGNYLSIVSDESEPERANIKNALASVEADIKAIQSQSHADLPEADQDIVDSMTKSLGAMKTAVPGYPLLPSLSAASMSVVKAELEKTKATDLGKAYAAVSDALLKLNGKSPEDLNRMFGGEMLKDIYDAPKTAKSVLACLS